MRLFRPLRLLLPFVAIGVALVVFLALGFLAFAPNQAQPGPTMGACDAGIGAVGRSTAGQQAGATLETLSDEQKQNANTIIGVGKEMNTPPRAWLVALATAMQESTLRNIDYGDRDSLGLFQQRPSQGWGSPAQVTDPLYSSRTFYERLLQVPRWEQMPVTVAAQTVQRSAFPDAYAKWETLAAGLVGQFGGVADPAGCGPSAASLPAGVARAAIEFALGEVGKPYVWGATGPNTYDCSGLMLRAFEAAGVQLPRVSRDQYRAGGHLPVRDAQPGDLMFYAYDRNDPRTIHHVFLYLGNDQMVEAPYSGQNVRVQPVNWEYDELVPLATRPGTPANTA
ncbi:MULTISPECIES: C40 family peptidase [Pseudonocardia]|uniref:NlpC/P60 family protein n=1 Tax=Pseudonocardia oroxyli TaxID=366584 RepID=A0A1G7LAM2_PSEOR|nr:MULTISPECIES: C40 family peptidase [Pseudonocardia]MCF7552065.1 C40 family peptidase [Pseudonocardia sp. WMMC193]SDF46495.1 NlpC/P60 family protein [Pseudonocardia oroxyli]